jgi:hypothetical protein
MHEELAALGVFFDPLAIAAALRDALDAQAPEVPADENRPDVRSSGPAAVNDHDMLRRLLPQELYGFWKEAGYIGIYSMTFMLRHAVTFLALAAHERACPAAISDSRSCLDAFLCKHFKSQYETPFHDCFEVLCPLPFNPLKQQSPIPVLGFSSLGVHLLYREIGSCRAFDYYGLSSCTAQADGLFCPAHQSEAWWCDGAPTASTQADMFRFYAFWENIHLYDERQLEELVGRFWTQFKRSSHPPHQQDGILEEALHFFRYASLPECFEGGPVLLRRRYTERARVLHPDTGGEHALFVQLHAYYEVLRTQLNYERAGLFA